MNKTTSRKVGRSLLGLFIVGGMLVSVSTNKKADAASETDSTKIRRAEFYENIIQNDTASYSMDSMSNEDLAVVLQHAVATSPSAIPH